MSATRLQTPLNGTIASGERSDDDETPWAARLVDGGGGGDDEAAGAPPPPPSSKPPAKEVKAAAAAEPIASKKDKLKKLKPQPATPQKAKKKKKRAESDDDDDDSAASFNEPDDEEEDYKPEVCVRLAFNRLAQYSSRFFLEEKTEKINASREHFVKRRRFFCNAKARQRCDHRRAAEQKAQSQIGTGRVAIEIVDCESCETQESCKRGRGRSLALVRLHTFFKTGFCICFACRWEEEKKEGGVKWNMLTHKGPLFAPPYEPLPKSVKFRYDNKEMQLSTDAEEVATFYAKMLDHEYTSKAEFNTNFFKDWRKVCFFCFVLLSFRNSQTNLCVCRL